MLRRSTALYPLIAQIAVCLTPIFLSAEADFHGGPPDGRTGAPGETTCTGCHGSFDLNSGDGNLQIIAPDTVYEGQPYTVTVQLEDPGQSRWGFEITVLDTANEAYGELAVMDSVNTQLSDNPEPARDYLKHTADGTYAGISDGPVTWEFLVIQTSIARGPQCFYLAGNAANNNGVTSGDYIYTSADTVYIIPQPEIPSSSRIGLIVLTAMLILAAFFILNRRRSMSH